MTAELRDIDQITREIEIRSQSAHTAPTFTERLIDHCENFARLPGLLGQARHELREGYRRTTFGSYVIFFRYVDGWFRATSSR